MNFDEMEAGEELDTLVAECVMGQTCETRHGKSVLLLEFGHRRLLPHYSTSIEDAWLVVEKLCQYEPKLLFAEGIWQVALHPFGFLSTHDEDAIIAFADAAPLAICRAALKGAVA